VHAYSQFVIENLVDAGAVSRSGADTVVMAGASCIQRLKRRFGGHGVTFVSLSHVEALAEFASADRVWTSPGLTASLECFQLGVPTLFLPPQNYSQWCLLRAFRRRGLAPGAFHWEDVLAGPRLRNRLPEAARNPRVRAAIRELSSDARAARAFRQRLRQAAQEDLTETADRQRAFLRQLGPNGATVIAERLAADLN
jgi:hypothetical protein